jgi:hypothetical protein
MPPQHGAGGREAVGHATAARKPVLSSASPALSRAARSASCQALKSKLRQAGRARER